MIISCVLSVLQGSKFNTEEEPYSPGSGYPTTAEDTTQDSETPYSPSTAFGTALLDETDNKSSAGKTITYISYCLSMYFLNGFLKGISRLNLVAYWATCRVKAITIMSFDK